MAFKFDRLRAQKPVRVTWRLSAATVAGIEAMAAAEGVRAEEIAAQALDHVLEGWERQRRAQGARGEG